MRPGETVEVRTPNAIAAVRGTVMIVEIVRATAQATPPAQSGVTSLWDVLSGEIKLRLLRQRQIARVGSHDTGEVTVPGGQGATVTHEIDLRPVRGEAGQGLTPDRSPSNEGQDQAGKKGQDDAAALLNGPPPSTPSPNGTPSKKQENTSDLGTNQNPRGGGGNGGGGTVQVCCVNGGFETGSLASWVSATFGVDAPFAGIPPAVIPQLGDATISPPQGTKMAKIETDGSGGGSLIAQAFALASTAIVKFKYKVLTSEDVYNDGFIVRLFVDGVPFTVLSTSLSALASLMEGSVGTGFLQETVGSGPEEFIEFTSPPLLTPSGSAVLEFLVGDDDPADPAFGGGESDDEFETGGDVTAVLIDDVQVLKDPPLLTVKDGARYISTQREPLFSFWGETRTFDSLLLVCCPKDGQPSSVSLAGPLLRATKSNLTVPFSLVGLYSGGFLTSSTTDPLVLLEGGSYSLGSAIGVFDIQGSSTALDPATGLTLGTDRSLQTGGELFRADQGASVETKRLVKVDTALLEATAPLLHLMAGSSMTSASDLVKLQQRANVIATIPSDALIKLNASTLTVNGGSLVTVAGGSSLNVTGNLVSLSNGSTLNILSGSLVSVSGGSVFRLTGGSLGVFGAGTNALNITNSAPLCSGCSLTTSIANLGGYPVLLRNGALASNVTVASGFTPFAGLNGSNTVNVNGPSGAVLAVSGSTSMVTLGP
jgi:hypothetical protein